MTRIALTLLFALVAATSIAQPPQPPFGGPGGPPPFGGFGPPPGMGGGLIDLLGMREVQTELSLTEEQQAEINELVEKPRGEIAENFQRAFADDDQEEPAPPEARFAAMREKMDELDAKTNKQVQQLLKQPQRERLEQLQLQREGMRSPKWREIANSLELTEDQLGKLRGVLGGTFGPAPVEPFSPKVTAALNDDQQVAMEGARRQTVRVPPFVRLRRPSRLWPRAEEVKLVDKFDADKDGWLNQTERKAARESHQSNRQGPRGRRGGPPRGFGFGRAQEPGTPGPRVAKEDVEPISNASLYDPTSCARSSSSSRTRTGKQELADFHGTDVDVPATLTVDGKTYPQRRRPLPRHVVVHGRAAPGSKRSLNVSLRLRRRQAAALRLQDAQPAQLARRPVVPAAPCSTRTSPAQYIPAPKANFVKVVINGESWGVYVNVQQFDKDVPRGELQDARRGRGGRSAAAPAGAAGWSTSATTSTTTSGVYEIKSSDDDEGLEGAHQPLQGAEPDAAGQAGSGARADPRHRRRCSGSWRSTSPSSTATATGSAPATTASTCDDKGKFHIIPHDMNEAFRVRWARAWAAVPAHGRAWRGKTRHGGPWDGRRSAGPGRRSWRTPPRRPAARRRPGQPGQRLRARPADRPGRFHETAAK